MGPAILGLAREVDAVADELCPIAEAAKLLGDKWILVVLRDLATGPRRFTELAQSCERISPSVLAARLRQLEARKLVTRTSFHEIPPRVEYELTPRGADALPVLDALYNYGTRWLVPEDRIAARSRIYR